MKHLFLVMILSLLYTPAAYAADIKNIVVVDIKRIIQESTAAVDIREKIENKRSEYQAQITKQEEELRVAEQNLRKERSLLLPEAFEEKRKAFNEKFMEFQRDVQEKRTKHENILNQALNGIQTSMTDIVANLAKERKFELALPNSHILYAADHLDITDDVLSRLNKQLPTLEINIE